jgi:hypothetical protein
MPVDQPPLPPYLKAAADNREAVDHMAGLDRRVVVDIIDFMRSEGDASLIFQIETIPRHVGLVT